MRVIDFHTHIVPGRYPDRPASCAEPNWPVMEKIDDRRSRMVIAGRTFREFDSFYWNPGERIARLDEQGIAVQVISPLPELLSYWLAADAAEPLTDFMNGFVAEMVQSAPTRFAGMGCVALQDPPRAVRQLEHMRKSLGLRGVHVGSNINGTSLADARFYPVYAECCELGVPFCTQVGHTGPLMPSEVGRPIPYIDQVAIDFPELTIVCGHIGYPWTEEMIAEATKHPNVYIDTSAYTVRRYPPNLVAYLRAHGRTKVLFGSNWPMIAPRKALEGLAELELDAGVEADFLAGNAARVFGLAAPSAAHQA